LAAWCAAVLLADDDPWAPAYYGLAGLISYSRVHVRLHHASDVAAGALLGLGIGALVRVTIAPDRAGRRGWPSREGSGMTRRRVVLHSP
jgi:undecaprenyl-diphosphatase